MKLSFRIALEEMYGKSLQKLNAKAEKTGENVFGFVYDCHIVFCELRLIMLARSLSLAWKRLVIEFKEQGELHLTMAEVLRKNVAEPLLVFSEQQKKEHKVQQAPIEKAYKVFVDSLANSVKV